MISSSMAKNGNNILFLLIFFCFWPSAAGTNSLKHGDMLASNATLVSRNELFTLNFTNLHLFDSQEWYLAIWHRFRSNKPCWLANRYRPIKNGSAVLLIDEEGSLTITNTGGDPIKLHSGQSKTNVSAILEDNGNFVLRETSSGGIQGQSLWQSFDYATDSLLPGMKLGINHKTGQRWLLTSWFTDYLPNHGAFTLEWEPSEHQLIIKRRGVRFWTSGVLNNGAFENFRVSGDIFVYNFTQHSNDEEEYLTHHLINLGASDPYFKRRINVSLLSLAQNATLIHRSDGGGDHPAYEGECDGTSTVSGCERWKGPECRRDGDAFHKKEVIDDASVRQSTFQNANISFSDCMDICWNDCTCFGVSTVAIGNAISPGCLLWHGPLKDVENGREGTICYVIVPGPPGRKEWIWIATAVGATFIVLLLGVLAYLRWRRLRMQEKFLVDLMTLDNPNEAKEIEIDGDKGHNLKIFSVSSIMDATDGFSTRTKLGEGGFGPVYKGLLSYGHEIAIKKLSGRSGQGLVEFKNELILIAKLQLVF